jgi:pimeloyl-ACP methyl ester carboxylesterase
MIQKQHISLTVGQTQAEQIQYQAGYWEAGAGQPILFLHGFMGRGECWEPLVRALQADYRCICLDQLGFGESSKPTMRYDIAKLVTFVRAFGEALGIENPVLVGHSLGGWVAAASALAYPDWVKALVLVAPAGIRDDSFCGRYDHLRPLLWQTPLVDWALVLLQPLSNWTGNQKAIEQIGWMRRELNNQPAPRSFLLDRMRPEDAIDTVEKEIHRLSLPTLVIAGAKDETIPLWHSQTYASEITAAQLVVIPSADHALPQNHATEMAEILTPFLAAMGAENKVALSEIAQGEVPETNLKAGVPVNRQLERFADIDS